MNMMKRLEDGENKKERKKKKAGQTTKKKKKLTTECQKEEITRRQGKIGTDAGLKE